MAGRNTDYSEEMADRICDLIAADRTLRQIELVDGMPSKATILAWLKKYPEFQTKCAQARIAQADSIDDRIGGVIDKVESGELPPDAARVMLSGLQWRAEKKNPKVYGSKTLHAAPDGESPPTFTLNIGGNAKGD